jgi:3'(2'), 5'-bisphosphate nucleotidase
MTRYDAERKAARDAARLAGQLCLAIREEMLGDGDPARLEKAGREPVTIADYGAQAVVLRHIAAHFPDDGVIAEEGAADFDRLTSDAQRERIVHHVGAAVSESVSLDDIRRWLDWGRGRPSGRIWTVDPIDGTKGFLRGDQFAVAVALLVRGEPVVSALACPLMPLRDDLTGAVATAVRGEGADVERLAGGDNHPLQVSALMDMTQARIVESVESGHTDHSFSGQVLQEAGVGGDPVRIDSQAKYLAVAAGRAEIYIRGSKGTDYRERIWDHAAGMLIVEEAGGRVTDLDGRPLDFSQGDRLINNRGILATNGPIHQRLLDAIQARL